MGIEIKLGSKKVSYDYKEWDILIWAIWNIPPSRQTQIEFNRKVITRVEFIFTASDSGLSILKSKNRFIDENAYNK